MTLASRGHRPAGDQLAGGIIRCEPVWEFKPYRLVDFLLWCVLDGVGTAWIKGREMPLGRAPACCWNRARR
jgi:hypothetical protein